MKTFLISVLVIFGWATYAIAVGTCPSPTVTKHRTANNDVTETIVWSYLSAEGGTADCTDYAVHGNIRRVVTNPGAAAPTDNWDATLKDADGIDVMATALANRDTADSEQILDSTNGNLNIAVDGPLTLQILNAGNAKTGTVTLYVKP